MTTLVVEDGTGVSNANAPISLAEFKTYCDDRGKDYSAYTDDEINQAIIRAGAYMKSEPRWEGWRTHKAQTMPFPRYGVWDRDGWPIDSDEIPADYKSACAEVAFAEAGSPGTMAPSVTQSEKVLSERVGELSVTYANIFTSASDARPVLTLVQDLLRPFVKNGSSVTLLRA